MTDSVTSDAAKHVLPPEPNSKYLREHFKTLFNRAHSLSDMRGVKQPSKTYSNYQELNANFQDMQR